MLGLANINFPPRYVAPNAVSNISQIEYDYSDYYDEIEEEAETSKIRRDASNEVETVNIINSQSVSQSHLRKHP